MNRFFTALVCCLIVSVLPSLAQQNYGANVTVNVPYVAPGKIVVDGNGSDSAWTTAPSFDMTKYWNGSYSGHPTADVTATSKVLWTKDTLYIYTKFQDYENFYWGTAGNPWQGDQILLGIDGTHAKDTSIDAGYAGWPHNAPGNGPTTYKVWKGGITLNWGYDNVNPVDSGWAHGVIFIDTVNFVWGAEMAIYVPQADVGNLLGFNIGGASGSATYAAGNNGDGAYAYYSWSVVDTSNPVTAGGDVMNNAKSYGTLNLVGGPAYGANVTVSIPYVAPGKIVIDGNGNDSAWTNAPSFDLTKYWNGSYSGHPTADVTAMSKVLWTTDSLYIYTKFQDYENFYWGTAGNPWQGDQILAGIDGTHAKDTSIDAGYAGWPHNAPGKGPTTYKVWKGGITLNWGYDNVNPVDSGWAHGVIFIDTVNFVWGSEMVIYVPQARLNSMLGFNIGGASASATYAAGNNGDGSYAYYSWSVVDTSNPVTGGGDVMNNAKSYGTLHLVPFVTVTGVEEHRTPGLPQAFVLGQNYPNPFNPSTRIAYEVPHAAHVLLSVYNVLGQRVATLVDGEREIGRYDVQWDAAGVGSGMYFYQLSVDGKTVATKKMMLLK